MKLGKPLHEAKILHQSAILLWITLKDKSSMIQHLKHTENTPSLLTVLPRCCFLFLEHAAQCVPSLPYC